MRRRNGDLKLRQRVRRDEINQKGTELSSFDRYRREVLGGSLSWTPIHTEPEFWRHNVNHFDEKVSDFCCGGAAVHCYCNGVAVPAAMPIIPCSVQRCRVLALQLRGHSFERADAGPLSDLLSPVALRCQLFVMPAGLPCAACSDEASRAVSRRDDAGRGVLRPCPIHPAPSQGQAAGTRARRQGYCHEVSDHDQPDWSAGSCSAYPGWCAVCTWRQSQTLCVNVSGTRMV